MSPAARPQDHGPARPKAGWAAPRSPRSVDHHAQPLAGVGERALDLLVVLAFGEDEAQVPVSFGERMDGLAGGDGDGQAGDSGHGRGFGAAFDRLQHACPLDGEHKHAGGPGQAARRHPGSRDGVISTVSSKVGPSGVPGLSKTAVTVRSPPSRRPSMLSSHPGTYSSMSSDSFPGRPAVARICRIRPAAATAAAGPSARRIPWLALSDTALTTQGYPTRAAAWRSESSEAAAGTIRNAG